MKKLSHFIGLAILMVFVYACSVKKDTAVSRTFHSITTKYNVLFNGEQAYLKGKKEIEDQYQDNFWKRLPIEPISFDDHKISGPNLQAATDVYDTSVEEEEKAPSTPFDKAEEKARKAIETHSMNINGYEKNRQIDNAYLLLGKSRYYTQRFIPAIEAFNYIISNYPKADLIYDTKVWRAKANIRLDNEKLAIESLKLLLELDTNEKDFTPRQREAAHTAMAMAYEKTDTIQKVIEHLRLSATFKNKEQSARNLFVLGQIYSELNRKDSAVAVFKELADTRIAPYKYRIRANVEMAKNIENDSVALAALYRMRKLIRNTDNRKFLDALYYQAGVLEERRGTFDKAEELYKKSLRTKNISEIQKTYSYEALGTLAFKQEDFLLAGSYYDSVVQVVPKEIENEKRIRRIKRKNRGLTNLKKYNDVVVANDSILNLVAMSSDERAEYFNAYIEKIKKADEEQRQQALNQQNFGNSFGGANNFVGPKGGKWYFYNPQLIAFGKANFEQTWGTRPLEDNWRWSDKATSFKDTKDSTNEDEDKPNARYELATYIDAIPTNKNEIVKLEDDRNEALYQLGLIYKEQFKNTKLATASLERLLRIRKNDELELPIHYHLYQLYQQEGNDEKATASKNLILTKYANSTFAQVIKNPKQEVVATSSIKNNKDIATYKNIYNLYKINEFEKVLEHIKYFTPSKENSNLIPKLALLKALAIGKYQSKKAYKEALDFVALTYANTEEGKKAKEIVEKLE